MAVAQAKEAADRLRPLLARHEVSEQQLFDAEKALEQASIQQQTAEAQLQVMMIGPRPEAVAEAEGKIKTADALVAFSQAHLDYHTIRAPIDGVLDSLTLPPRPDDRHRHARSARWSIPGRSSRRSGCRLGRPRRCRSGRPPASGTRDARDPGPTPRPTRKRRWTGKVAFVGRVADPQTGNLPIRVLVDNPAGTAHDRAVGAGVDHRGRTQGRAPGPGRCRPRPGRRAGPDRRPRRQDGRAPPRGQDAARRAGSRSRAPT